jgi:hypothetical protein
MIDPRIYRAGFIVVALAIIVVAFSLIDGQRPFGTTLAPDAFSGQNAYALTRALAAANPERPPGGTGDDDVATSVSGRLRSLGYRVSTDLFSARTVSGTHTLENVIAVRPGLAAGSIVVLAHRDASGPNPSPAALSGTGVLLELARALAGENESHSIVLVSTSGSAGAAGAMRLARTLPGPIDAVLALGDLASSHPRQPIVVPWSGGAAVASTGLRNTLAAALGAQANLKPGGTGLPGQLLHLALPLSSGEQAPFNDRGIPAVTLSLSDDRSAATGGPPSPAQVQAVGRAVLQTVDALDAGSLLPRSSPYLIFSGKIVPDWAMQLLVLALLVPVLPAAVDGFARARRRGHAAESGALRTVLAAAPFALAAGLVIAARLLGVLGTAPPGPVAAGAVPLHAAGIAVIALAVLVMALGVWLWLRAGGISPRGVKGGESDGSGVGALLVLWLVAAALWWFNPYAALLAVPAVHLWMWLLDGELRPHPALGAILVLGGLAAPVLAAVGYAHIAGLGAGDLVWAAVLLLAGGVLSPAVTVAWCLLLGGTVAVIQAAVAAARAPRPDAAPVTVRGPVTYAGPGSLGGTGSALRR